MPVTSKGVPYSNSTTSKRAAKSMEALASTQREAVLDFIRTNKGATCEEIELSLDIRHSSCSARLWEMNYRLGMITDSGEVRPNKSGRKAIVWKAL